jgi:hypothetical protein
MIDGGGTKVAERKPLAKADAPLKGENAKTKNATGADIYLLPSGSKNICEPSQNDSVAYEYLTPPH